MRNNKVTSIFTWVVIPALVIFLIVWEIVNISTHHTAPTVPKKEVGSAGNPGSLIIEDTGPLSSHLLSEQFGAVKLALEAYIQNYVSGSASTATIVPGSTVLNNDGSINFTTQVGSSKFNVLIQIPNAQVITFSIPAANYQQTLYPYGSSTTQ